MIIKTSYPFMKPPPSARLIRGHRLAQGLVCDLLFNENGGLQVFDFSENNNTGVVNGNPVWRGGKFGSILELDGTGDYTKILFSPTMDLNGNTNFTVSILAFADSFPFEWTPLLFKAYSDLIAADADYEWVIRINSTNLQLRYWVGSSGTTRELLTSVATGVYHHFVIVFSGSNALFYRNGVFITSVVIGNINDKDGDLYIGAYNSSGDGGLDSYWDGSLDVPIIWNRPLSASEVAELYAKPFGMFERRARTALMSGYEVGVPPTLARAKIDCGLASTSPLIRGLVA